MSATYKNRNGIYIETSHLHESNGVEVMTLIELRNEELRNEEYIVESLLGGDLRYTRI